MSRRLLTVEHCTEIEGHGIALFPGFVPEGEERFEVGDLISLRPPNSPMMAVPIADLSLPTPNPDHRVVVLLSAVGKADVPVGTEVWSHEH
jgi:hypothetical protein